MAEKKNMHVIYNDAENGSVQISEDVMAQIAAIAACDVEGVEALKGGLKADHVAKASVKNIAKSTRLSIVDGKITVDIVIITKYGFNLPEVCKKIQSKVKDNLENMTGLTVEEVNVSISDVSVKKDKQKAKKADKGAVK